MLDGRVQLAIGGIIPLKAFNKCATHHAGQIGVFAVSLMSAPPARVSEDIDIRAPVGQPLIDTGRTKLFITVVFCACLGRNRVSNTPQQIGVKRRRHPDCLWENSRRPGTGDAVQSLIPPVISGDMQLLDCRCVIPQLADFFVKRHFFDQFNCLFMKVHNGIHLPFCHNTDRFFHDSMPVTKNPVSEPKNIYSCVRAH